MIKLPERKIIKVRNEVDRYGFSYLLSARLGFKYPPRSFCGWMHGWFFWDVMNINEFGYGNAPHNMPIVTATMEQRKLLLDAGFKTVIPGGLPYAYLDPIDIPRSKDSILIFLPHTISCYNDYKINTDILDYIYSIKDDFSEVTLCIYSDDMQREELITEIDNRNLSYISGAQPNDANSLIRMQMLFQHYEYVMSSGMGSHLLYASYSGCKTSISGPYAEFVPGPYAHLNLNYKERLTYAHSESVNREKYPWFFVKHPKIAQIDKLWCNEHIGSSFILDNDSIADILGWSVISYSKAVMRGINNRLRAIFK